MKALIIVSSVAFAVSVNAAQYKLKSNATAALLDSKGAVVETKTLKAGTIVSVEEAAGDNKAAKATRLTPSKITVAEFRATKPSAGAVFRAKIEQNDYPTYYGIFEGKEKSILQYEISVIDKSGCGLASFTAYVQKTGKIGKLLRQKVEEGKELLAYVKIRIIKQMNENDVYLDDIEFL